jgi:hypothetical protein
VQHERPPLGAAVRVSWEDLDADAVERFLAQAGDEGLTWEGKGGGDRPRPDTVGSCRFRRLLL